jgi:hypothetical protein
MLRFRHAVNDPTTEKFTVTKPSDLWRRPRHTRARTHARTHAHAHTRTHTQDCSASEEGARAPKQTVLRNFTVLNSLYYVI